MYDPHSVAFEIKWLFKNKSGYRYSLITIWHIDPETDGTDDSCGWFIRERHVNKEVLAEIQKEFAFNIKHNYWFNAAKKPIFSTIGTVLEMYRHAAWVYFKRNRTKQRKFMRNNLDDIMHFAENPVDCIGDTITNKFGANGEERLHDIDRLASIIYRDILRRERKWYQQPRWHFWHWRVQFNFIRYVFAPKQEQAYKSFVDENLRQTV